MTIFVFVITNVSATMKRFLVIAVALVAFATASFAQSRAIGLRAGYGGELSYQHSFGSNFGEFDLGWWGNHSAVFTGAYDFILAGDGDFNVYLGPAAQLGTWLGDHSGFNLGVGAQFGFEYNFPIPLQISLDWRPMFSLVRPDEVKGFHGEGVALGIRYRF